MQIELAILFQIISLAIVAGGAYTRVRQLGYEIKEIKKDCKERVDALRNEHSDYHELKIDISVIKSKLESLDSILKHIYNTSVARASLDKMD